MTVSTQPRNMRVIALDIDGVLNVDNPMDRMDEEKCIMFDKIVVEAAPLYVVLSSSWRKYPDLRSEVERRFVIHGRTPTLASDMLRGDELDDWLKRNRQFTRWAVLDDEDDFYDHQNLFQTDSEEGLTWIMVWDIVRFFNERDDEVFDNFFNHDQIRRDGKKIKGMPV